MVTSVSLFLFYFIFAKNKLLVLSKAQTLALRTTQPHQTKCTDNSIPRMSPLEHENDNSSPPIPRLRMCEPVPPLPHAPLLGGMYGRIILFCRNTTLRKRSFLSPITADTLSFLDVLLTDHQKIDYILITNFCALIIIYS